MHHPPDRPDPRRRRLALDPRFPYRLPAPPRPPRRPAGGLRAERRRPRNRLLVEARALHTETTARLCSIDGELEGLIDQRLACLDVLVDCRDQLRPGWGRGHSRRRASIDEAPFPEAPPAARPVEGLALRSVALTILRRHGPQRLRDLHALIHLYGYSIAGRRPVQRLGDAMAYEQRQGRLERLERGVYGPVEDHPGPRRYQPATADLEAPLRWERPITDPGPPHLDPDVAHDPELWSGAEWPTEDDFDPDLDPDGADPVPGPDVDPHPESHDAGNFPATGGDDGASGEARRLARPPATQPSERVGDDSSTNRRPRTPARRWRWWAPPP